MATLNFGIGYVDPLNGDSGADGYWWDDPLDTIENAISAGFTHIRVLSGRHTLSSISSAITLELMPGKHRFDSAPVVCTAPVAIVAGSLGGLPDISGAGLGAVVISSDAIVTDYFQFDDGATVLRGGFFSGISFDGTYLSRSAIYCDSLSHAVAEGCSLVGSSWDNVAMFYIAPSASGEASYWRLENNLVYNRQLLVVDNDNAAPMNGWVLRHNKLYGIAATDPLIDIAGSNGQTRGLTIINNHFEGTAGSTAAACYLRQPTNQLYWYGNSGENLNGTNNLILRTDDAASAYVEQSLGDVAADGNVQINGTLYSATSPDTGSDGTGGRDLYRSSDEIRVVIMGRY